MPTVLLPYSIFFSTITPVAPKLELCAMRALWFSISILDSFIGSQESPARIGQRGVFS
jgi:hypothetical protein